MMDIADPSHNTFVITLRAYGDMLATCNVNIHDLDICNDFNAEQLIAHIDDIDERYQAVIKQARLYKENTSSFISSIQTWFQQHPDSNITSHPDFHRLVEQRSGLQDQIANKYFEDERSYT